MTEVLPCIVCGNNIEPVDEGLDSHNQPYAGTNFLTYGHYGSTVFDPMVVEKRIRLEINICDGCLLHRKDNVYIVVEKPRHVEETYIKWDGKTQDPEANSGE